MAPLADTSGGSRGLDQRSRAMAVLRRGWPADTLEALIAALEVLEPPRRRSIP
jgi:hypothetical protein